MNDNSLMPPEGPRHAEALRLLGELQVILDHAGKSGLERIDPQGEPVFDFSFWAAECRRISGQ